MNKWRIAFFVTLAASMAVMALLVHSVMDQAVTIAYMSDGNERMDRDLKTLAQAFPRDRYRKKDIVVVLRRIHPQGLIVETECAVQLNGLRFEFNAIGDIVGIQTQAEFSPEHECRGP